MSDRTTITRLKRECAKLRVKLKEAQTELKWRRRAMRGSRAELKEFDRRRAEQDTMLGEVKKVRAKIIRLRKVRAMADDLRGNENERSVAAAMADKLTKRPQLT
jgi:hypothetical protein